MNLHGLVRGAISAINPDRLVQWLASTGNTVSDTGKQTPSYAAAAPLMGQIQPASTEMLRKYDYLQAQGKYYTVYFYGREQAINRVENKGGDLLQFSEIPGGTVRTWLIVQVPEQWPDWCRVLCCLQLDPNNPVTQL